MKDFAKIIDVREGTVLLADGKFTCMKEGQRVTVKTDADGFLYVECNEGNHDLEGHIEGDHYVGLYLADELHS